MKTLFLTILLLATFSTVYAGDEGKFSLGELKLKSKDNTVLNNSLNLNSLREPLQVPKRKAVSSYYGAGYSFVIFTDREMNSAHPVFELSQGEFLTSINLFFGFSIAQAFTIEFEPSIMYSSKQKQLHYRLEQPKVLNGISYNYSHPQQMSLLAFPLAVNFRFFPMYNTSTGFGRLFFFGAGGGVAWIREEYDNVYNNNPNVAYYSDPYVTGESTSQWQPIMRGLVGFTGAGGQFGFGGELRYNFIPLETTGEAFASRQAENFNSVDLTIRFYFSL